MEEEVERLKLLPNLQQPSQSHFNKYTTLIKTVYASYTNAQDKSSTLRGITVTKLLRYRNSRDAIANYDYTHYLTVFLKSAQMLDYILIT